MRKFVFLIIPILLLTLSSCVLHLGQGTVEVWIDHVPTSIPVSSAVVYVSSVKLHFLGHGDINVPVETVNVDLKASQQPQLIASFDANSGSYNGLKVGFSTGKAVYKETEYDIQIENPDVEFNTDFQVEKNGKRKIVLTIEGNSLVMEAGPTFTFTPKVSISV